MRLRVLVRADVEAALDLDALVDALADAFAALSAGHASMPPRAGVEVPGHGTVLLMGAHRHGSPSVTAKLVSLFPGHDPAHQAAIVVFDAATGTPAALMDGDAITAARTAAGSRLATRLLAREDADVLAVIGTGVQGEAHLRALRREREWAEVRSWAAGPRRRRALAERLGARRSRRSRRPSRAPASSASPPPATEPVLRREWLAPGAHVNSVGFTTAGRELDPATGRATRSSSSSRASPRSRRRPPAAPTSRARRRTPSSASSSPARSPAAPARTS